MLTILLSEKHTNANACQIMKYTILSLPKHISANANAKGNANKIKTVIFSSRVAPVIRLKNPDI